MAAPPMLLLQDVALTFGGTPLLVEATLSIGPGERLCLVGRNGSGKSTLLKIAAGLIEPDSGRRFLQPGVTVRYLEQEPDLSTFVTIRACVEAGLGPADDLNAVSPLLDALGLDSERSPGSLSGGELRRTALARALAPRPDVLLLDEPTNHLDLPAIEWLEEVLAASRSAIVLISHDRRFLERLTRATVWLDRGITRRLDKGFGDFEPWRDEVLAAEERDRHKLDRRIGSELDWIRYGVTARRSRNMGRLRRLQEMRRERREARRGQGNVKLEVSEAAASGKIVVEARGIAKAFGEAAVVRDVTLTIQRGDRVGFVGPNGSGKTTLLKLLLGDLAPDAGSVKRGANIEVATIDQRRDVLPEGATLREAIAPGGGDHVTVAGASKHVATYLKDFLFLPEQANTPVSALSGGERARLALARVFARPSNVLVLDEPTNDLDLETLDLLAELVADYPGTVLLVSHDRDFLDRTVTSVVASEGGGRWLEYAGGYSDMVAQRGRGVTAREDPGARCSSGRRRGAAGGQQGEATPRQAAPRRKLSFREKHDLEALPGVIEALAAEIETFEHRLGDPELFNRDPEAFTAASKRLEDVRARLSDAESRWLELEILKEELEAS